MKKFKKALLLVVLTFAMSMLLTACAEISGSSSNETVKISIDEWIGWQSLLDANGGLTTAPDSINAKNGISIEYVVMNDASVSSNALISGELQGAGYTVNRYAFLQDKFDQAKVQVVMPYITNFSNGGDGIISKSDIVNVVDLVGKKIAVPQYSEAQTLVEWLLNTSNLTEEEKAQIRKDMVYFETADDTAKAFFSGSVDAAATWEPYLTQAASSTDSRIFFDTSMSTNLILDGLVFKKDFVEKNEKFIEKLIDGALEASSMYKTEFANVKQMPMFELMTNEDIIDMANGADLATCSQNEKLLTDVAVSMYRDMANVWISIGEKAYPDKAEDAFTDKYVKKLLDKYPNEGDGNKVFNEEGKQLVIESPESLLSYNANIQFDLNSVKIKDESYEALDEFIRIAKILDGVYIQIEGNASQRNVGITDMQIIEFSKQRAKAVAEYFIENGISEDRIIVIGNGDLKPVDPENLASEINRLTDFLFKEVKEEKKGY